MARRRRSSASRTRRPRRRHGRRQGKGFASTLLKGAKFAWKHRDKIAKGVQIGREIGVPEKYLKYGDVAASLAAAIPKGSTRR